MRDGRALPLDVSESQLLAAIATICRKAEEGLGTLVAVILFAIMWLIFADVFARYLFNAPIRSARELTQIGLAAVVFCALPLVSARGEHVGIDFLYRLMQPRIVALYRAAISILCAAACSVLARQTVAIGGAMLGANEESAYLHFPLGYVAYGISATVAIAALAHVAVAAQYAFGIDRHEASRGADA